MAVQQIFGSFERADGVSGLGAVAVIYDVALFAGPAPIWTPGAVRTEIPTIQQTLGTQWTVLAWSLRARLVFIPGAATGAFGRLGSLWAGVVVDSALHDAGGIDPNTNLKPGVADFPPDLSTFAKVFDGETSDLKQLPSGAQSITPDQAGPLGLSYQLPVPQQIQPGSQLQMCLILTPTLAGINGFGLAVVTADYTISYDTG